MEFAKKMDLEDPLKDFRDQFHIPLHKGEPSIYFTGNSLGLQPKTLRDYIDQELEDWKNLGVEGHFNGRRPWLHYHKNFKKPLSDILGAKPEEVVSMNNLTSNLHLMMASFYQPTRERFKILMEAGAFPSDQYAVETQVRMRGFEPEEAIIEVSASDGHILSLDDISKAIKNSGDTIALVFFSGVQYYSGQFFNIGAITHLAHEAGAYAGFDLAHAAGNVPLNLHHDGVDFAAWCSYKYLNSGPGNVSGVFVHERHGNNKNIPRYGGWWGQDEDTRFLMKKGFQPMPGADGWQLSNVNILSSAAHLASLALFEKAGMDRLRQKSLKLTSYLEFIINSFGEDMITIITPSNPEERGCQLSLIIKNGKGKQVFDMITSDGVYVDWREPDVIRAAPVPMYNTFTDIFLFGEYLKKALVDA